MFLMQVASAAITITPVDVGCTYIQWDWGSGLTLTEMYFDGNVMCGYDTESSNITFTDLNPGELHTLQLLTAGDSGTNATYTLTANCTGGGTIIVGSAGGLTQPDDSIFWTGAFVGLMGLIVVLGVTMRK
jgi:hypothetical protein